MKYSMTSESPCVLTMIKDVRSVYDAWEDGAGQSDISVKLITSMQKFVLETFVDFPTPSDDGGIVWENETASYETYSWNEMTCWYFSNRPFHAEEFRLHNEAAIKAAYVDLTQEELESTSIEEFTRFLFNNSDFGRDLDVGYCHGDLGHRLF